RDRDLVVDTGMGLASIGAARGPLLGRPVTAFATHGHDDHIGGMDDFDDVLAHPAEAALLAGPALATLDPIAAWGADAVAAIGAMGCPVDDPWFVTALPAGVAVETYRQRPARVTRLV